MQVLELVDELYGAFVATLPRALRAPARDVPFHIGLSKAKGVPWSAVFGHEVTLGAPALFAEGMGDVATSLVRDAVLAHALAVIDAFVSDRIHDGQLATSAESSPAATGAALSAVFEHARLARDAAIRRLVAVARGLHVDFDYAHDEMMGAMKDERLVLESRRPTSFSEYEEISLSKQAVGFPASVALAYAAGFSKPKRALVRGALIGISVGLQIYDDVVDWEDDIARGGAWPVALAKGLRDSVPPESRYTLAPVVRHDVFASGVLAIMLRRSRRYFRSAARRAHRVGARNLGRWCERRAQKMTSLVASEAAHAGFAVRAHALGAWATEVLL